MEHDLQQVTNVIIRLLNISQKCQLSHRISQNCVLASQKEDQFAWINEQEAQEA